MVLGCTFLTVALGSGKNERLHYEGLMTKLKSCIKSMSEKMKQDSNVDVPSVAFCDESYLMNAILDSAVKLNFGMLNVEIHF